MWKQKLILTVIVFVLVISPILAFEGNSSSYSVRIQFPNLADSRNSSFRSSPQNPIGLTTNDLTRLGIIGFDFLGIKVESTPPLISITNPLNQTYLGSVLDLTFTTDSSASEKWYHLDNTNNITITGNVQFSASLGGHILFLYVNDSLNNVNATSISFSVSSGGDDGGGGGGGGLFISEPQLLAIGEICTSDDLCISGICDLFGRTETKNTCILQTQLCGNNVCDNGDGNLNRGENNDNCPVDCAVLAIAEREGINPIVYILGGLVLLSGAFVIITESKAPVLQKIKRKFRRGFKGEKIK